MKSIINMIKAIFLTTSLAVVLGSASVSAVEIYGGDACSAVPDSTICKKKGASDAQPLAKSIIDILLWIVGVVSVIMIIISGIKYVTSTGDASKVASAKNTLMYAVVGVVVAAFAYAIVNYVYTKVIV